MEDAWEVLREAGLPDGPARRRPSGAAIDRDRVRRAVDSVFEDLDRLEPRRREPLLAWMKAGLHHWPKGFSEILGDGAERRVGLLENSGEEIDGSRYLKLRRIAVQNLSAVL